MSRSEDACARCGHPAEVHCPVCSDCGNDGCRSFVDGRSIAVSMTLPQVRLTMTEQVELALELLGSVVGSGDVCRFCCDDPGARGLVLAGDRKVHDANCSWLRLMIATGTVTHVRRMN